MTAELRRDMTVEDVRKLLGGWRESSLPSAIVSVDKHLYYTIDLTPPPNLAARRLRLTFHNGLLVIWGEPAILPDQSSVAMAG